MIDLIHDDGKCPVCPVGFLPEADLDAPEVIDFSFHLENTFEIVVPSGTSGFAWQGIDRHLGCGRASFSLNGHRVSTIGNICMDMCMLDVTGTNAKPGDTVTIFGEDPTVSELADILGTIPYEIMTSIPRRIDREIIK